jgi:hypothetical protein
MYVEQIAGLLEQPSWASSPEESDPRYFRSWQRVSIALQKSFRQCASEIYFRDPARLRDLEPAYTLIVFSACRRYYGRPRCDFTYDVADPKTFHSAWRSLGNSLRTALAPIERRLRDAGDFELAHRYAAVWHLDVLRSVKRRPRPFIRLIARETRLVEAVIDLGTRRGKNAALRFQRIAENALLNFHGVDMTELIPVLLEEATRVLSEERRADFNPRGALAALGKAEALRGLKRLLKSSTADRLPHGRGSESGRKHGKLIPSRARQRAVSPLFQHPLKPAGRRADELPDGGLNRPYDILDAGIAQNGHARAAGCPNFGIGGQEDGHHRSSHRRGKMANAGIVAEVDARSREPASELV